MNMTPTALPMSNFTIPVDLPPDKLSAAKFYRNQLGWAVHPLYGPTDKNIAEKFRGKKPRRKYWKQHVVSKVTDEMLEEHFANGYDANLGVVIRPPHVVVDLDSKQDAGESVVSFISGRPDLQTIPRERTAGGVHLHFRCLDLPPMTKQGKPYEKPLESKVADGVNAEFFFDGCNLVIAPSIHATGASYIWEVTGEMPVWPWEKLRAVFGFRSPDEHCDPKGALKRNLKKGGDWKATFKADLSTLDIVRLTREVAIYGEPIDPDKHSHSVQCFWGDQHSDSCPWRSSDTSTAIFEAKEGRFPGFKCLHVSHGDKTLEQFLQQCEQRRPGIVDQCCGRMRVWSEGQIAIDGRPRAILPGFNRSDSEFATECGEIMSAKKVWFQKNEFVTEVRHKHFSEKVRHLAFHTLKAVEVRSAIEDHIEVGKLVHDENQNEVFVRTSMSDEDSAMLIHSPQFKRELQQITRVLAYRIPIIQDGQIVFPELEFDERFGIYTDPNAPAIVKMDERTASMWLHELTNEFCFDGPQSLTHYLARLLTPLCRAVMQWNARGPFWIFCANRERLGKDYLAGVAGLLYDGYPNEDAPLEPRNSTETRKRITSAIIAGRARIHFANCAGHIQDSALEQAITSNCWSDRVLGSNTEISLPNELELSMSGNVGVLSYPGDLAHRARHCRLYYAHENPNSRRFSRPDLHRWVIQHRSEILSALITLMRKWVEAGQPKCTSPFASFPRWAEVVGGIMLANGLGDPCLPEEQSSVGGDEESRDIKHLFSLAHEKFQNVRVELKKIQALISDGDGQHLFGWLDLTSRGGQTSFGKMLRRYEGRIFEDIILKVHPDKKRPKFSFEKCDSSQYVSVNVANQLFANRGGACAPKAGDVGDVLYTTRESHQTAMCLEREEQREPNGQSDGLNVLEVPEVPRACAGYDFVTTTAVYPEIAAAIRGANSVVALDLETTSLEPWRGEIRLLSLALPGRPAWIIDLGKTGYDLGELHGALQNSLVIGHNIKFDLLWLLVKCGLRSKNVFCTVTAARLLHAGSLTKSGLEDVRDRYLNLQLPDESRSNWSQPELTREQLEYAANDVVHLSALKLVLEREIADAELQKVCDLEMRLLPIVVDMEKCGFLVDQTKLNGFLEKAQTGATEAKRMLCELVGEPDLNANSPAELKRVLTNLGLEIENTKAETLASIDHPATRAITEYRKAGKRVEQAKRLLKSIACDGRIHTCFNPTGTDTGRFSSSKPNLQNIGRGEIRSCFIAATGYKLVVADYSQVELRAVAALVGEERMLEAYRNKEDLHLKTAAVVLKREATRADRQQHEAEDLTQEFFARRVVTKLIFRGVHPGQGKFRTWLLNSLQNLLRNEWDRKQAQKRGGDRPHFSLDLKDAEGRYLTDPGHDLTPEKVYERTWAMTLVDHVLVQLQEQYEREGKATFFAELKCFLPGALSGRPYAEVAARTGKSEEALKMAVSRLRQQYGQLLRAEIKRTVSSAAEVREELQHLIAIMGE